METLSQQGLTEEIPIEILEKEEVRTLIQSQQSQELEQEQEQEQNNRQEFEQYENDEDEEEDEEDEYELELKPVLEARVTDVSLLENNLAPLCLKKDQMTKVLISSNGLYFNVEGDSKNIQTTTFIDASLFERYEYNLTQEQNENEIEIEEDKEKEKEKEKEQEVETELEEQTNKEDVERVTMLRINLSVLLDCLGIFKAKKKNYHLNETVAQLIYPNQTGAFEIDLEDGGVVTWCSLAVNSIDDNYVQPQDEMKFDASSVTNTIVMDSMGLKVALGELDWACRTIGVFMFQQPSMLSMQTIGQNGICRIDCPSDSEAVERLDSSQDQSCSYLSSLLRSCVKALQYSTKVSIRMNMEGMLSVQLMIKNRQNIQSFVEFLINPEEEGEDEEDDEEEENYVKNRQEDEQFIIGEEINEKNPLRDEEHEELRLESHKLNQN
ncbi:cell cycle checkpoint protein rad1 [Anaeramoeba flamelloides]|uniref:Cell cycle checkpoint protein rad1 n=1 Tax=Anaeramoeba flamelloides TaxID=1746091 RepID=A0ABQ8YDU1_9EUKA|nr:cell cycle checkpoint protein rad1 [Anaeramoeba flamelloides]